MASRPRSTDPHPALVAAIGALAFCAFFPMIVVWILSFGVTFPDQQAASEQLRAGAYWLIVALLVVEYAVLRHHDRTGGARP